ncbi:hypothetical protein LC593_06230 [Nostoc sp. CHAB 5844]|nr:hypothetical protein [Nostoc sp. CHAB 5844]
MNSQILNLHQTFTVAIAPPSNQPKSANQFNHNLGYFTGIFVVSVIIGLILGCFIQYRSYQKQRYHKTLEIIQEIENLDKSQHITTDFDEALSTQNEERKQSLQLFANNLSRVFYGFEPDFFQQNVSRIVDDVISQFHASLEIWPTLVEICYFYKDKKNLPQIRVKNDKLKSRNGSRFSEVA